MLRRVETACGARECMLRRKEKPEPRNS